MSDGYSVSDSLKEALADHGALRQRAGAVHGVELVAGGADLGVRLGGEVAEQDVGGHDASEAALLTRGGALVGTTELHDGLEVDLGDELHADLVAARLLVGRGLLLPAALHLSARQERSVEDGRRAWWSSAALIISQRLTVVGIRDGELVGRERILATVEGDSLEGVLPQRIGLLDRELLPDRAQELAGALRAGAPDDGVDGNVIVAIWSATTIKIAH